MRKTDANLQQSENPGFSSGEEDVMMRGSLNLEQIGESLRSTNRKKRIFSANMDTIHRNKRAHSKTAHQKSDKKKLPKLSRNFDKMYETQKVGGFLKSPKDQEEQQILKIIGSYNQLKGKLYMNKEPKTSSL